MLINWGWVNISIFLYSISKSGVYSQQWLVGQGWQGEQPHWCRRLQQLDAWGRLRRQYLWNYPNPNPNPHRQKRETSSITPWRLPKLNHNHFMLTPTLNPNHKPLHWIICIGGTLICPHDETGSPQVMGVPTTKVSQHAIYVHTHINTKRTLDKEGNPRCVLPMSVQGFAGVISLICWVHCCEGQYATSYHSSGAHSVPWTSCKGEFLYTSW